MATPRVTRPDPAAAASLLDNAELPGSNAAARAIRGMQPSDGPPSAFPGRRNGHTTSGLDMAMQQMANREHPVG